MPIPVNILNNKLAEAKAELDRVNTLANDLQDQLDNVTDSMNRYSKLVQYYDLKDRELYLRDVVEKISIQLEGARYDKE